ncbi:MAG TPA: nitroreductase [Bacteroidales bacterium]|nr:nitroreductase [Bacteroidales bacterium]
MEEKKIEIDRDLCSGCGLCKDVCPTGVISFAEGKATASGEQCISCGHCAAICPQEAICVAATDEEMSRYKTFTAEKQWLPPGNYNTSLLVQLMASRRSCRRYTDRPVALEILRDLVKIGVTAPSGTNSQLWCFTLVPSRREMVAFGEQIGNFYHRLNRISERAWLRTLLKWCGKPELDFYYRNYHDRIADALEEWRRDGRDRVFHGAPSGIIVSSSPGASCPAEDALLATQSILLGAHSMGLGTCLIGFAVEAIKRDPAIQNFLEIPQEETVYSVIAIGYPAFKYHSIAGRRAPLVRSL